MDAFNVHCRFASKLDRARSDFLVEGMHVQDDQTEEKCGKETAEAIAGIKASIFENLTLLRMKVVVELTFDDWCTFLTRRVTMQIQMAVDHPKAYADKKGVFYCFFNKFSNGRGSCARKVGKLTKSTLHGHTAFTRYLTLLPESVKIHLRTLRDGEKQAIRHPYQGRGEAPSSSQGNGWQEE